MAAPVTATAAIGRAVAAASNATSANAILTRLCPHSAGQLIQQKQKLPSKWQAQSPSTIIKSILPETSSYTEGGPPVDRNWSASATVQGMRNMLALTPSAPVRVCPTKISLPLKAMCPVKSSLVATSSSTEVIGVEVRPYEDIPQPKGWPIVGTWVDAICKGVITRMHEYIDLRYQQLGPIYREKLGSIDAVFLFDPKDVENVFQKEGKNPRHIIPEAWIIHRDMTKKPRGLFFMDGEQWSSRRRIMNQLLFHPRTVPQFTDRINQTIDDLIDRWIRIKGDSGTVDKVEVEMFNWSIECIGTVLFDQRMGCLSDQRPADIQEFVCSIQEIFRTTMVLTMIPPKLAKLLRLPVWSKFLSSMDTSMMIARKYIYTSLDKVIERMEKGQPVNDFCSAIMAHKQFDVDEVVRLTTDLFAGAADTVSNAMAWALYLVSQDGQIQENIYKEVISIVPTSDTVVTADMLKQMHYVKAVMKETLRLYPIVPFNTRYIEEDIVIKGYNIPANTPIMMATYSMGRDKKTFKNPDKFMPERWLRDPTGDHMKDRTNNRDAHYATVPFGFGPRCCVGRRLAETEMHMLLAKLVRRFKIEYAGDTPIGIHLRLITAPNQSVKLKFTERSR